jgi:pyruvate dehydrogenase E1 component alpha subunit
MPRLKINLSHEIEYLSIYDENDNLDESLEPKISKDTLLKIYRSMLMGRLLDERMLALQRQGRIGTFAPVRGQEASLIGPVAALRDNDWLVPAFREHPALVMRGVPIENILLTYGGFYQGLEMSPDSTNMPPAVPVGSQPLHAAGIGYAIKYRKEDGVAMVFFGEGATSEGDFHEAMNFAVVYNCPTVFVCQNNHWAISVPRGAQTGSETIAQKALAYGMPGIQVDGNDFLATYSAAQQAIERARKGEGPTLIENVTYRMGVHTTADDPKRYRDAGEVERWEKCDPITRIQQYLLRKKILTEKDLPVIEEEIKAEIQRAIDAYEAKTGELANDSITMFDHLFAEMPAYLKEQRDLLEAELKD